MRYGDRLFACRHCLELAHENQREAPYERCFRKAENIKDRLGWERGLGSPWGKRPKGMHRRTFDRLVAEICFWEDVTDRMFKEKFGQRL